MASVFTAKNCLEELAAQRFQVCIVDEAHHTISSTWLRVLAVSLGGGDAASGAAGSVDEGMRACAVDQAHHTMSSTWLRVLGLRRAPRVGAWRCVVAAAQQPAKFTRA